MVRFSGKSMLVMFVSVALIAGPAIADDQDSPETRIEQQRALAVETAPPTVQTGQPSSEGGTLSGVNGMLFVGVDNTTISTYSIDPVDNATTPLFTGNQIWGAAMIPAAAPGDAVVYISSGTTLYRWPADGVPELCCTLTYQSANQSTVGVAYDPNAGELLFSRNIANEGIYSLPAVAANCPASCELTLQRDYDDTLMDAGGIAYDGATDTLYAVNDDATPANGIYIIEPNASLTFVAPYPANETDIDGLAFGDGRLYLVIDQPGSIFVYDVAGATYDTPLVNPWTTSELFSGGAYGTGLVPVALQQLKIE